MSHTPASDPFELVTTPPMLVASTLTALVSARGTAVWREAASVRTIAAKITTPEIMQAIAVVLRNVDFMFIRPHATCIEDFFTVSPANAEDF